MRWLALLYMTWTLLATATTAACSGPRARKAWGAMTTDEQNLYVEAVGYGMRRGYHILFTELHSEAASATEAYQTCGFLYWNRRFLLAYENMLRSLGTKYECVTIPYWDYFADYSRFLLGVCQDGEESIEACSPILRGLGGSSGDVRQVTINGLPITGNCVASEPASYFCETSAFSSNRSLCSLCIPRADWNAQTFPSGFGYAGLAVLLSEANGHRQFSNAIQYGIHNSIHNALSSTMATYMGPADPVFFSHHATIDMLQQIYLECQLGSDVKASSDSISRFAYQQCSYRDEQCPSAWSKVTQLWKRSDNVPPATVAVPAERKGSLWRFFTPTPSEYWQLVSIKDLGAQSYEYQLDELMSNLQTNGFVCPRLGAQATAAPEDMTGVNSTTEPTPTVTMETTTPTETPTPSPTLEPVATDAPMPTEATPTPPSTPPTAADPTVRNLRESKPSPPSERQTTRVLRRRARPPSFMMDGSEDFSGSDEWVEDEFSGSGEEFSEFDDEFSAFEDEFSNFDDEFEFDGGEEFAGSEAEAEATESPDDITFSSLYNSPVVTTTSTVTEEVTGVVSAPDLTVSEAVTVVDDAFESATTVLDEAFEATQSERQYVQEKARGFLEAAVEAAVAVDGTLETAYAQSELIECSLHDRLVGVKDYSRLFRDNFHLDASDHPRCFSLLRSDGNDERAATGRQHLDVKNWKEIAGDFYAGRHRRCGD